MTGMAASRPDVAEAQHGGAVADHGHGVAGRSCTRGPGDGSSAISQADPGRRRACRPWARSSRVLTGVFSPVKILPPLMQLERAVGASRQCARRRAPRSSAVHFAPLFLAGRSRRSAGAGVWRSPCSTMSTVPIDPPALPIAELRPPERAGAALELDAEDERELCAGIGHGRRGLRGIRPRPFSHVTPVGSLPKARETPARSAPAATLLIDARRCPLQPPAAPESTRTELFLIDGNSLAYRAFFALPETIATSRWLSLPTRSSASPRCW